MRIAIAIMALAAATACSGGDVGCDVAVGPLTPMPDLEVLVGDTVETDLRDHFDPKSCVKLIEDDEWVIWSADPSAVAVARVGIVLELVALAVADSVRVSVGVEVRLPHEPDPPHEFLVRVRPR